MFGRGVGVCAAVVGVGGGADGPLARAIGRWRILWASASLPLLLILRREVLGTAWVCGMCAMLDQLVRGLAITQGGLIWC